MKFLQALSLTLLAGYASLTLADTKVSVTDLNWIDKNHLQSQVNVIDDLGRTHFGTPVRNNKDDLELLQRIINKGLIPSSDSERLQALGAVLGNVMATEFGLEWKVYEDSLGRSRAICVKDSQDCLFPITMLSRRMETGLLPNVQEIFEYCHDEISLHLPQNPYDKAATGPVGAEKPPL